MEPPSLSEFCAYGNRGRRGLRWVTLLTGRLSKRCGKRPLLQLKCGCSDGKLWQVRPVYAELNGLISEVWYIRGFRCGGVSRSRYGRNYEKNSMNFYSRMLFASTAVGTATATRKIAVMIEARSGMVGCGQCLRRRSIPSGLRGNPC